MQGQVPAAEHHDPVGQGQNAAGLRIHIRRTGDLRQVGEAVSVILAQGIRRLDPGGHRVRQADRQREPEPGVDRTLAAVQQDIKRPVTILRYRHRLAHGCAVRQHAAQDRVAPLVHGHRSVTASLG